MVLLDLILGPLLHAGQLTWDEFLVLGAGIALIILVGFLGRRAKSGQDTARQLVGHSPNGKMPPQRQALFIQDVSHRYGTCWALARISLNVPVAQCLSILGPNGAGKTTLLHVVATLVEPTAGDIVIGQTSLQANPVGIRRHVGLVSHKPLLYPHLTAWENLQLFGQLYGIRHKPHRAEALLHQVGLWDLRYAPVNTLSHGQQQRVAIARSLMHNPDILLLDEPYNGLDLRAAEQLDTLLDELMLLGHTLLITTHDLHRSLARTGQVVILAGGRMFYHAHTQDLTLEALHEVYKQAFR